MVPGVPLYYFHSHIYIPMQARILWYIDAHVVFDWYKHTCIDTWKRKRRLFFFYVLAVYFSEIWSLLHICRGRAHALPKIWILHITNIYTMWRNKHRAVVRHNYANLKKLIIWIKPCSNFSVLCLHTINLASAPHTEIFWLRPCLFVRTYWKLLQMPLTTEIFLL